MALVLRLYYGLYYGCVVVIHNSSEERFTYSPSGLVLQADPVLVIAGGERP